MFSVENKRFILTCLSKQFPGIHFYSNDIASDFPEKGRRILMQASLALCSYLQNRLPYAYTLIFDINGATYQNVNSGRWNILVEHKPQLLMEPVFTDFCVDVERSSLKTWISDYINSTPETIIMEKSLFENLEPKYLENGEVMSPEGQLALSLATICGQHDMEFYSFKLNLILSSNMSARQYVITVSKMEDYRDEKEFSK